MYVTYAGDGNGARGVRRALARFNRRLAEPIGTSKKFTYQDTKLIEQFQRKNDLVPDGIYGPKTHAKLSAYFDSYAHFLYTGRVPPVIKTAQLPFPYAPTHETGGLAGYPAIDVFAPAGTEVLAPAAGVLQNTHMINWNLHTRVGGNTTYLHTATGVFFLTHFQNVRPTGAVVKKGDRIGTVAEVPQRAWAPHIHMGFNKNAR